MQNLPEETRLYNEYHAQIVQLAKTCCRKNKTFCSDCPLNSECDFSRQAHSCAAREKVGLT
jgi:endonuclease-3 related protein